MPIKMVGNTIFETDATSILYGASPLSYWLRFQIDAESGWVDQNRQMGCHWYDHTYINIATDGVEVRVSTHVDGSPGTDYANAGRVGNPLQIGVTYCVAVVMENGAQKVYLNGLLLWSGTQAGTEGRLGAPGGYPLSIGCYDGLSVTMQDPAMWSGYALSQSDVIALRDRTKTPAEIGSGTLIWWLTCDGTNGATVALNDPGITDGSSQHFDVKNIGSMIWRGYYDTSTPPVTTPVYTASNLLYTTSAKVKSAIVSPARTAIYITFSDLSENLVNVTDIITNPTLTSQSVNGGSPVTLTNPIWGITQPAYLPFVYYQIPSGGTIGVSDTPTISAVDPWATTSAGSVRTITDYSVDNTAKTTLLPAFVENRKTMEVGYNVNTPPGYGTSFIKYTNLFRQSNLTSLPAASGQAVAQTIICISPQVDGTTTNDVNRRTYTLPADGYYTLKWDGPGTNPATGNPILVVYTDHNGCTVTEVDGSRDIASIGQTKTNNTIQYHIVQDATYWSPSVSVAFVCNPYDVAISNLRLYGPDPSNLSRSLGDDSPKFHPSYLAAAAGSKALRFMGVIDEKPGGGNIVDYSDFTPDTLISFDPWTRVIRGTIIKIEPFDDPTNFFGNTATALMTFASPHGIKDGQYAMWLPVIYNSETSDGSFPLYTGGIANGKSMLLTSWILDFPLIINSTQIALAFDKGSWLPNGSTKEKCTVGKSYTGSWSIAERPITPGLPLQEAVDLCNAVGADFWMAFPFSGTNDCATQFATFVGQHLAPGKKLWVELGNESWNGYPYFTGAYCENMARVQGLSPPAAFFAKRSNEVHNCMANALATLGRGSDLKRVMGTGSQQLYWTEQIVQYCTSQSPILPIDAIAIAPYFGNFATIGHFEYSLASIYDSLTIDQQMDLGDLFLMYGGGVGWNTVNCHYQYIGPGTSYPNTKIVCYEGGPANGLPGAVTSLPRPAQVLRSQRWCRHPRMRWIMLEYLQKLQDAGVTLYLDFFLTGDQEFASEATWSRYQCWNMKPGMGDGSDGLFDNRINLESFSDYPNLVSVVGGAINKWNSLVEGSSVGYSGPTKLATAIDDILTTVSRNYKAATDSKLYVTSISGLGTLSEDRWVRVSTARVGNPISILKAIGTGTDGNGPFLSLEGTGDAASVDGYHNVDLQIGDLIELRVTAGAFNDIKTAINKLESNANLPVLLPSGTVIPTAEGQLTRAGIAPDPGASSGTAKFLREDATWDTIPNDLSIGGPVSGGAANAILFCDGSTNLADLAGAKITADSNYINVDIDGSNYTKGSNVLLTYPLTSSGFSELRFISSGAPPTKLISFGCDCQGMYGGSSGTTGAREFYVYDWPNNLYVFGCNATQQFIVGPSITNYGLIVNPPSTGVAGVVVNANGTVSLPSMTTASASNGQLFVDSSTNSLCYKNSSGVSTHTGEGGVVIGGAISGGTNNRIIYVNGSGVLADSGPTWDGSSLTVSSASTTTSTMVVKNTQTSTGVTALEVHGADENPYLAQFFNDTYSTSVPIHKYFGWNTGQFGLGGTGDLYLFTEFGSVPKFAIQGKMGGVSHPSYVAVNPLGTGVASTGAAFSFGATFLVNAVDDLVPTVIIKGVGSQTQDLQQWTSSTPTVLTRIRADGSIALPGIANTAAVNESLFWDTLTSKLTYKDSTGTLHAV